MLPLDIPASSPADPSFDCPPNIMEAIDWILRVTGKDGQDQGSGTDSLTTAVNDLLTTARVKNIHPKITISQNLIENLAEGLAKFIGYKHPGSSNEIGTEGIAVGKNGTSGAPWNPGEGSGLGYRLTYHRTSATWDKSFGNNGDSSIAAKIFLGCVPLCFYGLSYLYWRCEKGGWKSMMLGGKSRIYDLKGFMVGMGYSDGNLNGSKNGSHIASSAFKSLNEFNEAMTKASQQTVGQATSSFNCAYTTFTKQLREEVTVNGDELSDKCPLSALFYGASCYFRYQQMTIAKSAVHAPKTIREMLYFLAALQFSPQYDEFDKYVTSHFKNLTGSQAQNDSELKLQVADSAISSKGPRSPAGDTLSAADLKSHLLSSCLFAPALLGVIQDHSASNDEPWLHELYNNTLHLQYHASGYGLFNALSNYSYALQFQLYFLYAQCRNTYSQGCGWRGCRYGKEIESSGNSLQSHICPGFKCQESSCDHKSNGQCNHNKYGQSGGCGQGSNKSPLQAFLTDCLKGFCVNYPSPSSHLATCSGFLCHVPMGFTAESLRDSTASKGAHISATLKAFCGGFNTPLRQLSEKLGCLTKRTPRTLGDLFGFIWHLNGQLFKSGKTAEESVKEFLGSIGLSGSNLTEINKLNPSSVLKKVQQRIATLIASSQTQSTQSGIEKALSLFPGLPFWHNLFMIEPNASLPVVLFKLKSTDHRPGGQTNYTGNHNDLYGLYNQSCASQSCGPYLYPLTHSDGATYAPRNAFTYLSWVLYLTDDLQYWLQEMLDEFKNIDCKVSGCMGNAGGSTCTSQHQGTHGTSTSNCSCPSVVDCADVPSLLYPHGFRFLSAFRLKGVGKGGDQSKRTCKAFADQLQSVISGEPLTKLLETIDTFLFLFRKYFLGNLSGFWSIYTCLILYTFFFLLDTLHLRSHLKLTSLHVVLPLALLTSGKPLPVTKLAYLRQ
ncbi:variant erythrocyte surface antigen-1 family protein [Babesia caballi]|uniref:Variant erythrocyte surface antigen-1 family protein n=1 Tax=Babesia caballi TaxID=5871 RepID=A0AAV4LQD9_BABCB|nr:variant erythrocyte surface antigen-1 family protein [Babesia caballi]